MSALYAAAVPRVRLIALLICLALGAATALLLAHVPNEPDRTADDASRDGDETQDKSDAGSGPHLYGAASPASNRTEGATADESHPGFRGPVIDPWARSAEKEIAAGRRHQVTKNELGPHEVVRITSDTIDVSRQRWSPPDASQGFTVVEYDLSPVAPSTTHTSTTFSDHLGIRSAADAWWRSLIEIILARGDRERWSDPRTRLAWEAGTASLYVCQDAEGHALVSRVLEEVVARRSGTVRVLVHDKKTERTLGMDVPWTHPVRASAGTAWVYLQDYDVELSQGTFTLYPMIEIHEVGLRSEARRVEVPGGAERLDIALTLVTSPPVFEPFESPAFGRRIELGRARLAVEVPEASVHTWRGRIAVEPGTTTIELGERTIALEVVDEPTPEHPASLIRTRSLHPTPAPTATSQLQATTEVHIRWLGAGALRGTTSRVPLRQAHRPSIQSGTVSMDRSGTLIIPLEQGQFWPPSSGGVRLTVRAYRQAEVDILDLVVERAEPALLERRSPPVLPWGWRNHDQPPQLEALALPVSPMIVESRRVHVPVGKDVDLRLQADPDHLLRISVRRGDKTR